MNNILKHMPKIRKKDTYGKSVVKYIVMDSDHFNIGEFDNKVDSMCCHFNNPGSTIYKFMIYELIS